MAVNHNLDNIIFSDLFLKGVFFINQWRKKGKRAVLDENSKQKVFLYYFNTFYLALLFYKIYEYDDTEKAKVFDRVFRDILNEKYVQGGHNFFQIMNSYIFIYLFGFETENYLMFLKFIKSDKYKEELEKYIERLSEYKIPDDKAREKYILSNTIMIYNIISHTNIHLLQGKKIDERIRANMIEVLSKTISIINFISETKNEKIFDFL